MCRRLGEDLRTQTGITHVEPVARSKYYHDPVFQPFRDRCPGLELNGLLWPAGRMDPVEGPEATRITEEELEEFLRDWGLKLFGTRNFKMYHLDLDGDPSNGKEHEDGLLINATITQEELANMIGVTRESVNRNLGMFRRLGLIGREGRRIVVRDEAGLRGYCE